MKEYTTYEIKELADFLEIPEKRLGDCLQDFHSWIERARAAQEPTLSRPMYDSNFFLWHDDGEHNAMAKYGKMVEVRHTFKRED